MKETDAKAIFEVTDTANNHVYKIWADGRTEGFPENCLVNNKVSMLLNLIITIVKQNADDYKSNADELCKKIHRMV